MGESSREISQRELRNDSGAILRAVEGGETFVVTRNGTPIAELHPLRRKAFVPSAELVTMFRDDPRVDRERFFGDLDGYVDQDPLDG
jgi:prevent-host-death family protein